MKTILVTGAGGNASMNFVSCLKGLYRFVGIDLNKYHLECADLDARYITPPCGSPEYIPALQSIIADEGVDFLHAQPDVEVEVVSQNRRKLPPTFLPEHEEIVLCHDKLKTNSILTEAGVPVPKSFRASEELGVLFDQLGGEKIWVRAVKGAGSRAALPVTTTRQASEWMRYWRENRNLESQDFMLAEFLPGKEFAWQSLWSDGVLVTSMARTRMEYMFGNLMPSGQSSSPSVAKTVHDDRVNMIASSAVRAVSKRPHGIYCVDLKENREGTPCVTEINIGRFFTTSNFFAVAGSNMPLLYTQLGLGENVEPQPKFNAVPENIYWVRGVDREPQMFIGEAWTNRVAAHV